MNHPVPSFAINTFSFMQNWTALDCINHLADAGYSSFELMTYPGHLWPSDTSAADIRAIRQACESNGLKIVALNVPNIDINVAGASAEIRAYSLQLLAQLIRLGGELNAEGIVLGTGRPNALLPLPLPQAKGHLQAGLNQLFPIAKSAGVSLLVENVPFCFLPRIDSIVDLLEEVGNSDIGIVFDAANAHFAGDDIPAALRLAKSRLRLVHLSDTTRAKFLHAPIGDGDVPFAAIPPVLSEIGFKDTPVLEIISDDPDAALRIGAQKLRDLGFT